MGSDQMQKGGGQQRRGSTLILEDTGNPKSLQNLRVKISMPNRLAPAF